MCLFIFYLIFYRDVTKNNNQSVDIAGDDLIICDLFSKMISFVRYLSFDRNRGKYDFLNVNIP